MSKNGNETKKTAAVATDTPAATETAAAEVTQPAEDAEGEVRESKNDDDPCAVPVVFLVLATSSENNFFLLRYSLRSLAKNLRGVNAEVKVLSQEKPKWLADDTWIDEVSDTTTQGWHTAIYHALNLFDTERIVLMTDRMFLARPVNIADIALLKAEVLGNTKTMQWLIDEQGTTKHQVWNYHTNMPAMYFKTPLRKFLEYYIYEKKISEFYLPTAYFNMIYPELQPTLLNWSTDGWLLPVISEHPKMDVVRKYLKQKKFLYIAGKYAEEMISLLKFLTPDPAACEILLGNEDHTDN